MNKKTILLVAGILLIAGVAVFYSQYGLEFGKFFAAEPGVTATSRAPMLSLVNKTDASRTDTIFVGDKVVLKGTWLAGVAVQLCQTYNGGSKMCSNSNLRPATTNANGVWNYPLPVVGISVGNWTSWIIAGGAPSNHIAYTIKEAPTSGSTPTPMPTITPTPTSTTTVTPTPAPTPPSGTVVTITSPNGGEVWKKGQSYTVTWTTNTTVSRDADVQVILYRYDDPLNPGIPVVAEGYFAGTKNTGSYAFTIPVGAFKCVNNSCPSNSTKVKAYVSIIGGSTPKDYSDNYFTVTD